MYRLVRTFHPGDMGDRHVAPILGQVPVPMTLLGNGIWYKYVESLHGTCGIRSSNRRNVNQ